MIAQIKNIINEKKKSVKSINQFKSMIQTIYDIIKVHGEELKVGSIERRELRFIIQLLINI
jgi:hypothetical protein